MFTVPAAKTLFPLSGSISGSKPIPPTPSVPIGEPGLTIHSKVNLKVILRLKYAVL